MTVTTRPTTWTPKRRVRTSLRHVPHPPFTLSFPTSDDQPMAENLTNMLQMVDLIFAIEQWLTSQGQTRFAVGGNQFVYYNPRTKRDNLSPDVYVALDVTPGGRQSWLTWREGKFPDITFEIASPSTQDKDVSLGPKGKRRLYGRLGVQEYYVFDPGAETPDHPAHDPSLRAYRRDARGRLATTPLLPSGGVWSALLSAEVRPEYMAATPVRPAGLFLRLIDPATDRPVRVAQDEVVARAAAESALHLTEDVLHRTEDALRLETRERQAAEDALAVALAELERLRGQSS